ncbi:hypothetical protein Tco_0298697 [Tanacetum coccineum]
MLLRCEARYLVLDRLEGVFGNFLFEENYLQNAKQNYRRIEIMISRYADFAGPVAEQNRPSYRREPVHRIALITAFSLIDTYKILGNPSRRVYSQEIGLSALDRIMEMEPDIENMTLSEYLEYEVANERRLRRNVRSK